MEEALLILVPIGATESLLVPSYKSTSPHRVDSLYRTLDHLEAKKKVGAGTQDA